jgi:uncharacterized protein (TIGR01777 family)
MKVIVSGATGFIGAALVEALLRRGDTVVALSRNAAKARAVLGPRVEVLEWNPPELGAWADAFSGADGIVNLAGAPIQEEIWAGAERAWQHGGPRSAIPEIASAAAKMAAGAVTSRNRSDEERRRILESRVHATQAIVEAIASAEPRPGVLVSGSAIGYYGPRGDATLPENSPPGNDFLAGVIVEWEAAAEKAERLGIRVVLLRTGIVLGREDGALPELVMPFRLYSGGTMGQPGQWVSWIHIDDEVGLTIYALTHPEVRGPLNATAPNPVTMERFSRQIGGVLHRPAWVPFLPTVLQIALGEHADVVLASQRVIPQAATAAGYDFKYVDSAKALQSLLR